MISDVSKEKWGDRVCLWGNIDLIHTLPYGTVEEVEAEIRQRIKEAGQSGGYICATANSITDFCKIENIFAMTGAAIVMQYRIILSNGFKSFFRTSVVDEFEKSRIHSRLAFAYRASRHRPFDKNSLTDH